MDNNLKEKARILKEYLKVSNKLVLSKESITKLYDFNKNDCATIALNKNMPEELRIIAIKSLIEGNDIFYEALDGALKCIALINDEVFKIKADDLNEESQENQ